MINLGTVMTLSKTLEYDDDLNLEVESSDSGGIRLTLKYNDNTRGELTGMTLSEGDAKELISMLTKAMGHFQEVSGQLEGGPGKIGGRR